MSEFNLKELIHMWCDYKEDDDANRLPWIKRKMSDYKQGEWRIGE